MKCLQFQRIFKSPFYVNFKKHFCPDCNTRLGKIIVSKIVNSNSEDAKNFDFELGDGYMIGNVKFIWTEFQCPNCKRKFTIDEMKLIEKIKKRR